MDHIITVYHGSQSRIEKIKHSPTTSSCHQQSSKTLVASFCLFWWHVLHQVIILHPVTGRGLWDARVALSEDKRCQGLRELGPVFRCLPLVHRSHDDSFSVSVWTWSVQTVGNVLSRALKARTKNWKKRKEHRHKNEKGYTLIEILKIWILTFK